MVFDQLLANQFSQLANVSQLFSFKGGETTAREEDKSYSKIPYQLSSPSYFCQPLYQIPDVRPLLLDNEMYHFSLENSANDEDQQKSWRAYQQNPFNRYMQGLRDSMESDAEKDNRRNRVLDHLLARQGEPTAFYDEIITTARWYGSPLKTRIIIKSIYLQNCQALSYNRARSYDYFAASPLSTVGRYSLGKAALQHIAESDLPNRDEVLEALRNSVYQRFAQRDQLTDYVQKILGSILTASQISSLMASIVPCDHYQALSKKSLLVDGLMKDGQLDMSLLAKRERLTPQDFVNFSNFELKLDLFLGLSQHYELLARVLNCILHAADFFSILQQEGKHTLHGDLDITVERDGSQDKVLVDGQQLLLIENQIPGSTIEEIYHQHLAQLMWLSEQRKGGILLESILLLHTAGFSLSSIKLKGLKETFYQRCHLLLPGYVTLLTQDAFNHHLALINDFHWPIRVNQEIRKLSFLEMKTVIPHFIAWHNAMPKARIHETASEPEGQQKVHKHQLALYSKQLITDLMSNKGDHHE